MGRRSRPKTRKGRRRGSRVRGLVLRLALLSFVLGTGYLGWLDLRVQAEFDGARWAVPARIYARPLEIYPGARLDAQMLIEELEASGYQPVKHAVRPGTYARQGAHFTISTRAFKYWDYPEPPRELQLRLRGGSVEALGERGRALPIARIDPALIGRIYPSHREDRILVRRDDVPPLLIDALLAVEDRRFFDHFGLSPRAILRAAIANLRARSTVQGGSTLTQQLAKNFFLSHERSIWRKATEALIALLLEARYEKQEILEAYLNEVFLGQEGGRAIHGFGLASHFYFRRPIDELELNEVALLVALVRGASYYNPRRHPDRALERRNLVLSVLAERNLISVAQADDARAAPLGTTSSAPSGRSPYPAFLELVRRQLRSDYHEDDLRSEGLQIFTTLDPVAQRNAEHALAGRVKSLERARQLPPGSLQGALVVTRTTSGEVLALVGDRKPRRSGFNRALDALRPAGSVLKPAVYLSALEQGTRYSLVTGLDDSPLRVEVPGGEDWSPANYDKRSHGTAVPLYLALAQSYNLATVRLGMSLGLPRVRNTLKRLGVEREIELYPSLFLGALGLTPFEVAGMYQTLANGGFQVPLRAIREVTGARGEPLSRYGLSVQQAFAPAPVFLLNRALSEVMRTGTGRSANARLGQRHVLAGKTGTTDDLRDSWFAGFDDSQVAVVWLGRDDNEPTGLTGASGALQVWTDYMDLLGPDSLDARTPRDVRWHWTDVRNRRRTDPNCPGAVQLPYWGEALPGYTACSELVPRGRKSLT